MVDLGRVRQGRGVDVVCAVDEDDVGTAHAGHEGDDAPGHDLVFAEQLVVANVAAREADKDDAEGEDGAPPAVEQRRVVCDTGAAFGGRCIVEVAGEDHTVQQSSQTPSSGEGELLQVACSAGRGGNGGGCKTGSCRSMDHVVVGLRCWSRADGKVCGDGGTWDPGTRAVTVTRVWARGAAGERGGEGVEAEAEVETEAEAGVEVLGELGRGG